MAETRFLQRETMLIYSVLPYPVALFTTAMIQWGKLQTSTQQSQAHPNLTNISTLPTTKKWLHSPQAPPSTKFQASVVPNFRTWIFLTSNFTVLSSSAAFAAFLISVKEMMSLSSEELDTEEDEDEAGFLALRSIHLHDHLPSALCVRCTDCGRDSVVVGWDVSAASCRTSRSVVDSSPASFGTGLEAALKSVLVVVWLLPSIAKASAAQFAAARVVKMPPTKCGVEMNSGICRNVSCSAWLKRGCMHFIVGIALNDDEALAAVLGWWGSHWTRGVREI